MDIIENIRQYLISNTIKQAIENFYFVPADIIIDIHSELNAAFYGTMILEEESWSGSDLNLQISI